MRLGILVPVLVLLGVPVLWAGASQEELEAAVKETPHSAELHYQLAEACYENSIQDENTYEKNLINKAMAEYKKAMDLDPAFAARSLGRLGIIQHELGFTTEARDKLERALKLDPGMKEQRKLLAKIYNNEAVESIRRLDYAAGLNKLEAALHLDPGLKDADENIATSYYQLGLADVKTGQFEAGIAKIKRAMEHKSYRKVGRDNLRDAIYNWGVQLSQLGNLDAGIAKFEEALDYGKTDELCKSLAVLYCKKAASLQGSDMNGAIDWYKQGIKMCPDSKDRLVTAAKNNIKALKQRMK